MPLYCDRVLRNQLGSGKYILLLCPNVAPFLPPIFTRSSLWTTIYRKSNAYHLLSHSRKKEDRRCYEG